MIALRPPDTVMRLSRLGASHQTRLSFMRVLLRGLRRGGWVTDRTHWDVDAKGVGRAVYCIRGEGQCYSLVAFAHDLPDELRSDRVIAEAWDATFTLMDGEPSADDLDRLEANVPLQEAGRVSDRELVLSRANRSTRLWEHVVGRLASGEQPDAALVDEVGYLMRTTAVYGSGKFGAADHLALQGRPLFDGPFRAEMLAVWLIRTFVMDLVEHMARHRGGERAVALVPDLRRRFGIGNSTGLGMAPFLVNHPTLLNAWITARETALARVRSLPTAKNDGKAAFNSAMDRTGALLRGWRTDHALQKDRLQALRADFDLLREHLKTDGLNGAQPWNALWLWAEERLSEQGQELLLSLLIEPHGSLVDELAEAMGVDEVASFRIDGSMTLDRLSKLLHEQYGWALEPDYETPENCARFWYVSEAKLEPRLGERHLEPGGELEQPLDIARAASALMLNLEGAPSDETVAAFLQQHPEHRRIVRRVQLTAVAPYSEIRDNLISAETLPIDMLRCKLAFFGATRFDPRSDRWVRITMYQDAPFPDELHSLPEDDWVLPPHLAIAA